MSLDRRRRVWTAAVLLGACGAGWAFLTSAGGLSPSPVCASGGMDLASLASAVELTLLLNSPPVLVAHAAAMTLAMMGPMLLAPLSRPGHGGRSAAQTARFIFVYGLCWTLAGTALALLALVLRAAPTKGLGGPLASLALGAILVAAWHASPMRRACLNLCHAAAAQGRGLVHAGACIGAAWPLMLLPLLAPGGHLPIMVVVTLWMASDRLEPAAAPAWRWRWPGRDAWRALDRLFRHHQPTPGGLQP